LTRSELALLSQAHAVALTAMTIGETRAPAPIAAAFALAEAAATDLPGIVGPCNLFCEALRQSHGRPDAVALAGRGLRDAVSRAMSFVPRDIDRVDIHG
jgi:hypothetical protein